MKPNLGRLVFLVVLLVASLFYSASIAEAQSPYPTPTGFVNDYSGVLTVAQGTALNNELVDFETKTSIEISVVTIDNLNGQSIEDYTRGLAEAWGVGKKGKNNGVVFLVSPSQQAMRIEIADGVANVLTDEKANEIRDQIILPRFREGNLPQGIMDGTLAIMQALSPSNIAPAEAQLQVAPQNQTSQTQPGQPITFGQFLFAGVIIVTIGLGLFAWYTIATDRDLQKRVQENREEIDSLLKIAGRVSSKHGVKAKSRKQLRSIQGDYLKLIGKNFEKGEDWEKADTELGNLHDRLDELVESMKDDAELANKALRDGPKLLKKIPGMLKATKKKLGKGKKSQQAYRYLHTASTCYARAKSESRSGNTNWLLIYMLLITSRSRLESAREVHTNVNVSGTWQESSYRANSPIESPRNYGFGSNNSFGMGGGFTGHGTSGTW